MSDIPSTVINAAKALVGTKYTYGGNSNAGGIDCSRLVQEAAAAAGVKVPRTAFEQSNIGAPVTSAAAAQPGDLVFFAGADGSYAHPGHVGIYLGNGMMIDANHTGGSVGIRSMKGYGPVVAVRRLGAAGAPSTPHDSSAIAPGTIPPIAAPNVPPPSADPARLHDLGTQLGNFVDLLMAPDDSSDTSTTASAATTPGSD